MPRVLDSSALLTGRQFPGELLTVPSVLRELRRHGMTPQLQAILDTQVRLLSPGPEALRKVREASEATGDARRLSPTDIELLALALEVGGTLVTDDYSIQNLARSLGLAYETVQERGIAEEWRWAYRCTGCGKTWPEWHRECPTCGASLKTVRSRLSPGGR